jgi:hypothetical protein
MFVLHESDLIQVFILILMCTRDNWFKTDSVSEMKGSLSLCTSYLSATYAHDFSSYEAFFIRFPAINQSDQFSYNEIFLTLC